MKRRTPARTAKTLPVKTHQAADAPQAPDAPPTTPAARPRSLHQQEADFTAEGSPPAGLVGGTPPVQTAPAKPAQH